MGETIDWLDHHGTPDGWRTKAEIVERCREDLVIRSRGEVLYENAKKLIIASETRLDKDLTSPLYRDYTVIYKKLVVKRRKWNEEG